MQHTPDIDVIWALDVEHEIRTAHPRSTAWYRASGSVGIDFTSGSRFAAAGVTGEHPVHDTVTKTDGHLNFFQHECVPVVRMPRVKRPDGSVQLVLPPFAGTLSGFMLLFEALVLMLVLMLVLVLVLMLAPQMPIAAAVRTAGISEQRAWAICRRYVALAPEAADFSQAKARAVDETSRARPRPHHAGRRRCRTARAQRH